MNNAATRIDPRGSARRSPTAGNRGQGSKWLHPTTRRRIYERDGWCCVWCSKEVARALFPSGDLTRQASIDHVVPRARGGTNKHTNLITCCSTCNANRGDRSVPKFAVALCNKSGLSLAGFYFSPSKIVRRVRAAQRRKLPVISRTP